MPCPTPDQSRPQVRPARSHSPALLPLTGLLLWATCSMSSAQPGGGFPPPLPPPPAPPQNLTNPQKVLLGKVLFWDEQVSSSGTVACGTCHIPTSGGSDPRTAALAMDSTHPGVDGVFGTADDIHGSMGRILGQADGSYAASPLFGLERQVTTRKTPSMINSAYFPTLFWDGRAGPSFADPVTGAPLIPMGGALESQAAGPPVSDVEMAHLGEDWPGVAARIAAARPLALAENLPADIADFVAGRTYPELFQLAFGSPPVTPSRIAMAIAAYERTLFSNQSPFDQAIAGVPGAMTPQQLAGFQLFSSPQARCSICHAGPLTSNGTFRNIGVTPIAQDLGRGAITGNPADNGRFKVPSLRNVALRGPYFHNGSAATLADVVEFYDRGGDFHVNQDPLIAPLNLNQGQKNSLVAFLMALTDPRVAAAAAPFDRPTLFTESSRQPIVYGPASSAGAGPLPQAIAIEPPILGNPNLTIGLKNVAPGQPVLLAIDTAAAKPALPAAGILLNVAATPNLLLLPLGITQGTSVASGHASISFALPPTNFLPPDQSVFFQWILPAPGPLPTAASEGIELRFF